MIVRPSARSESRARTPAPAIGLQRRRRLAATMSRRERGDGGEERHA